MKTTALTLTVTEAPLVTGLLALLCTCAQLATTSTLNVATKSSLNVAATSTLKEDILHVFLLMFNRHFTTLPWNDWLHNLLVVEHPRVVFSGHTDSLNNPKLFSSESESSFSWNEGLYLLLLKYWYHKSVSVWKANRWSSIYVQEYFWAKMIYSGNYDPNVGLTTVLMFLS